MTELHLRNDKVTRSTSTALPNGTLLTQAEAEAAVVRLAADQLELYRRQPRELISHANRETAAVEGYRGRQLLELLQNADDAAVGSDTARLLVCIRDDSIVVANSGAAFSLGGLESLVISDCSPKQLDRNRYIGCKGLGFRSVLTWSECPLISSGHLAVGFNRARAIHSVEALGGESEHIAERLSEFSEAEGHLPVPIMRFPFVPSERDLRLAMEYRQQGFDTVVVLRMPDDDRRDRVHEDVLRQLDTIHTEALLFCRSLTKIELHGTDVRRWEILREVVDCQTTRLIIQSSEGDALWTLYRREGRVTPPERSRTRKQRDYETAIAIPDEPTASPDRCLCVFFPTQDELPLPVVLHATLELSDDRNRVHNTDDNREVLQALAAHLADVVSDEADHEHPKRALRLLDGLDNADPELSRLGFVDRAVCELKDRHIFPRIGGSLGPAEGTHRTPHDSWHPLLKPEHFSSVLDVRSDERLTGVLDLFNIGWFEQDELVRRLRTQLEEMAPEAAGQLVGKLLATERLGKFPVGSFILTSSESFLEPEQHCFLSPDAETFPVPDWASDIQFVHAEFQRGLQSRATGSSVRALAGRLEARGARVDEYRLDTVVRALASRARQPKQPTRSQRTAELLEWLFRTTRGEPGQLTGVSIPVLTADGDVCAPEECYLGHDYPGGDLLLRIYSRIDGVQFVASPEQLGLGEEDASRIAIFLVLLGVNDKPKNVPLNHKQSSTLARRALVELEYPTFVREEECEDAAAALRLCKDIGVDESTLPEHFEEILEEADPTALVAFLLSEGQSYLASDTDEHGCFVARKGQERKPRDDRSVRIPNPAMLALRSTAWVPTEEGDRCTPGQVILSGAGSRLLRGLYFRHAIYVDDPVIQRSGGRRAVNGLLTRLGAISSLEAIDTDSLYELLERLPHDDPEGKHAPGIYRTLVEANVITDDCLAKRRFQQTGRVWSRFQSAAEYLPVSDVRYNANVAIPGVIEQHIKVAELPKRKSTKLVRDLFGIEPLAARDIQIELEHEGTDYDPSSEDANLAFRRALPFIYAIRLGKKLDEDNRERNLLHQAELRLCTCIRAEATLPNGGAQTIELTGPGDRLLLDRTLYIVDEYDREAASLVRFWQSVANLVAELLGTDVAAEVANVLRCRTAAEMEDVVRGLVDEDAEAKLLQARERFETEIEDDVSPTRPMPAPRDPSPRDEDDPGKDDAEDELSDEIDANSDESGGEPDEDVEFKPVSAPKRKPGTRRRLVITTGAGGTRTRRRGPLATEDVTFRLVEEYEKLEGRFPIRVSHLHGADGFGCDIISLSSALAYDRACQDGEVSGSDIARFIEVKGRSSRSGDVELTANEFAKAEIESTRYFLYRVFRDPEHTDQFEVAILADPVHSKAVRQITRFDLSAGSGADWYQVVTVAEHFDNEAG